MRYYDGGNNYTKNITLAKAYTMPKYMQVLKRIKLMNDSHIPTTRKAVVFKVWNYMPSNTYQNGPFTLLRNHGFIEIHRSNIDARWITWHITDKGRQFLAKCENHI